MANPWFRMWSEFAHDPKVQMLSEIMQRRLVMIFCLKCGNVLETLQETEIAFHLRVSDDELAETKTLFVKKGFITPGWGVCNWDKRQFASDSSTERVRKFREKSGTDRKRYRNVTRNDDETKCNAPEQNRTDTEQNRTDTEESKATPSHPGDTGDDGKHDDLKIYEVYPRKEGRSAAMKAIALAVRRLTKGEQPHAPLSPKDARRLLWKLAATYARSPVGQNPDPTKIPHPATWFNQSRYLDDQKNWQHTGADTGGRPHGKPTLGNRKADAAQSALEIAFARVDAETPGGQEEVPYAGGPDGVSGPGGGSGRNPAGLLLERSDGTVPR